MKDKKIKVKLPDSVIYAKEPEEFLEHAIQFQEYMMMYNCAIKEIVTKFEILNDELKVRYDRSPIEFIQSRVKSPESLIEKLNRRGFEPTIDNLDKIDDIAGVRIICSFIDDIYKVAEMLVKQDDITLYGCKDYIKKPKKNGYRSYHMIVSVPVFFSDKAQPLKVEVQIRTIAMDFWASLEHQLKYKKKIDHESELTKRLKECAEVISRTDLEMQEIRKEIENDNENNHEELHHDQ